CQRNGKEIESQDGNNAKKDALEEFAQTVKNPIGVITKGRKSKRIKVFNNITNISNDRNAKAKMPRIDQRNNDNDMLEFIDNNKEDANTNKRKCKTCGSVGHNARTCKNITESSDSEIEETSSMEEPKINKRKCRICGSEGHNARTCS
ncbi:19143_t:CDS:2, partial [Gigaspora rosea]